jgi:DNA adenine methylase
MVEIDDDIAAVWHTIIEGDAAALVRRISEFDLTATSAKEIFDSEPADVKDRAFKTILRNRISHGGVLAPGAGMLKNGENGKGIHSRWYPETLAERITYITSFRDDMSFIEGDGFEVMQKYLDSTTCAFFIDPPYTASKKCAGRRLYRHHQIDHEKLFEMVSRMRSPFMITYDESDEIKTLCEKYNLEFRRVPMKSTHHLKRYEYLICNDFTWLDLLE